jgi:hypothetical protein
MHLSFKPLNSVYGSPICAVDDPSDVIVASDMQLGIPDATPEPVICAFVCTQRLGCVGYNHRQVVPPGEGRCELYTFVPPSCTTTDNSCQYYQVKC